MTIVCLMGKSVNSRKILNELHFNVHKNVNLFKSERRDFMINSATNSVHSWDMSRFHVILQPVKKELRRDKCGFDHTPADDFVKSQWQSRTKSVAYLIYRWLIALFFTAIVIDSMLEKEEGSSTNFWLYFIYLTNWGVMLCTLTNILGAILVTVWHFHPEYADKLINMESLTSPFVIYWGMHIISIVLSIVITIIYWSVLYDATESPLNATTVLTHACNSILMFIDLLIVAHPLRLLHMFLPMVFGAVFAVFSVIYHICGGINRQGKPYIYHVIDWREPVNATLVVCGVMLLSFCIYMVLFTIYKLRTLLYRRINKASYCFPTTPSSTGTIEKTKNDTLTKPVKETGIQHSPSGISMVLGNLNMGNGYFNEAFTKS